MLTARSLSGAYKQLSQEYKAAHNSGDDVKADKLYNLAQDCLFDSYLTISQVKSRYNRIAA